MARLPYAEISDRLPQLNIFRLIANAQTAFRPFMEFGRALLVDLELDPVVREQAILRVAALTAEAQIEACRSGDPDDLVLRFTEEVVRDATPSDATLAAMTERFPPRQIVELILVVGNYMMLARLMATAQIDLEPPVGARLIGES